MRSLLALCFFASIFIACSGSPTATPAPTPDVAAIQTQAALAVFSTQTASAPTATRTLKASATSSRTHTPRATSTSAPTNTSTATQKPKPTTVPKPKPTATAVPPPVGQDQLVNLTPAWDVTLVSLRRDKTVFFYDEGETAFGVYASFLFRVRNKQSGSDHIGNSLGFSVRADGGLPIYQELFNTYEYKARWFYSCCVDAFDKLGPGEENVVLITFDVPENAKTLTFQFTEPNPFEKTVRSIGPEFVFPDFDKVLPRGTKP